MTPEFPGIYFHMPETDYHAHPAFSKSACSNMLISPLTHWIKSPMNPDYQDKTTPAMARGEAMDLLITQGTEAFGARYAIAPDPADYGDGLLKTGADLKAECKRRGLPVTGTNLELAERLQRDGYASGKLWPIIMQWFEKDRGDRDVIKASDHQDFLAAAACIRSHPAASQAFTGGRPQVSLFWVDEDSGQECKARLDYLKPGAQVEFKTFNNMNGLPVERACAHAIARHNYHMGAAAYIEGLEAIRAALADGTANTDDLAAAQALAARPDPHQFVFVFLEQGDVPNVVVRQFPTTVNGAETVAYAAGRRLWNEGRRTFRFFMNAVGSEMPWVGWSNVRPFDDEEFPLYMM